VRIERNKVLKEKKDGQKKEDYWKRRIEGEEEFLERKDFKKGKIAGKE